MNLDLSGKTALVCGGSKGLGYGIAVELAKLNCHIILLARTETLLKQRVQELYEINKLSNSYLTIDLLNLDSQLSVLAEKLQAHPVQILINNTGGPAAGQLLEASEQDLERAFKMHICASQLITQSVIPMMKEAGYGRIINIVSTSVRQPIPGLGVSNTIRGAMGSWSKTLSMELAPSGITVNNILPGTTKTKRIDELMHSMQKMHKVSSEEIKQRFLNEIAMGRFAEIHEVATAAAFLASPAASYITGVSLPVDGGKIRSI